MEPIAYLSAEVKHRDLESRLLIASHIVQEGFPAVVGQQWSLFTNAHALPPGVVLFKTVNEIQARNMANFRNHGHLVAATDEEALVCIEDRGFAIMFGKSAAANCDLFLAQNEVHREFVQRHFGDMPGRVEVAGNSRLDMLSPQGRVKFEAEAQVLRREHGPYILFNLNYGIINSIWNDLSAVTEINANAGVFDPNDPESVKRFQDSLDWERKNMIEMTQLIHWVAQNLKGYRIVVRPHPVERPEYWHQELAQESNVLIVPRSHPHPWILGSELVVHTGCTTGFEAALMDKPAVNLHCSANPLADSIVNYVNPTFENWQEAAAAIAQFIFARKGPVAEDNAKYRAILERYFPHVRDGRSSQKIAHKLVALLKEKGAGPPQDFKLRFRRPYTLLQRSATLKDKLTTTAGEIRAMLDKLRWAGAACAPQISVLDESLFLLTPS